MRKSSKYIVVAGALAALAAPAAAMADVAPAGSCISTPAGTAKVVADTLPTGTDVDATGCDIGVYNPTGNLLGVTIHGATKYGVYVDGRAADVTGGSVNTIGDPTLPGMQYGDGIYYTNGATGTISGVQVNHYQKNGIVVTGTGTSVSVTGNTVTGLGPTNVIAQNGIEIAHGASAVVTGNTVSGNSYTPGTWTACGLLFFQAGGVKQQANNLFANQTELCNAGRGGGGGFSA
jgi:hypothetical protein